MLKKTALKYGLVVGDESRGNPFQRGPNDYVVYRWRDRFASMPGFRNFLQQDWFFKPLRVASLYASQSCIAKRVILKHNRVAKNTGYGDEFLPLLAAAMKETHLVYSLTNIFASAKSCAFCDLRPNDHCQDVGCGIGYLSGLAHSSGAGWWWQI